MAHRKKTSPRRVKKNTSKPSRDKAIKLPHKQPDKNPDLTDAISLHGMKDPPNTENAIAEPHNLKKLSEDRPFCIPVKGDLGHWHCYYRIGPGLLKECNRIGPFKTKTQCERTICPCSV